MRVCANGAIDHLAVSPSRRLREGIATAKCASVASASSRVAPAQIAPFWSNLVSARPSESTPGVAPTPIAPFWSILVSTRPSPTKARRLLAHPAPPTRADRPPPSEQTTTSARSQPASAVSKPAGMQRPIQQTSTVPQTSPDDAPRPATPAHPRPQNDAGRAPRSPEGARSAAGAADPGPAARPGEADR